MLVQVLDPYHAVPCDLHSLREECRFRPCFKRNSPDCSGPPQVLRAASAVGHGLDLAVLDGNLAEGAGGFPRTDQLDRGGADIVDVLAFGEQLEALRQFTGHDLLARRVGDVHDLVLVDLRIGRLRRLHRQQHQRRRVIGLGRVDARPVEARSLRQCDEGILACAFRGRHLAEGAVELGAEVLLERRRDHAVGQHEGREGAGVERAAQDARTALIDIARHHERIATRSRQRADLGRIVGLAVLMRGDDGHGAALGLERFGEAVGQALAVVVVGIGHRHGLDAVFQDDVGHHFALTRVRGRGAEEQAVVLDRRERGRGRRGRDHHHAVRHRDIGQRGDGLARAHAADDALHALRSHHPLDGRSGRGGVDTGGIAAHRGDGVAAQKLARIRDFLHRQFGAGRDRRRDRFQRPGEAHRDPHLDVLGEGAARAQRDGSRRQKQLLHLFTPLLEHDCGNVSPAFGKRK
ncbi:hypothetical protein SDC9_19492 [bioreactor metagenome]|uniref:Uncharacterized protein n=1 Tax=bioreactor metagenome TaxID=1076179 RepID=A0A644U433_9ZZZZ